MSTSLGKPIVLFAAVQLMALASYVHGAPADGPEATAATTPATAATTPAAGAQAQPTVQLAESDFKTVANGSIDLSVEGNSPLFAEFQGSEELTGRLRAALKDRGFVLAATKEEAKAILSFRGEVALAGGPVFYKGVKLTVAEATDKALKAEQKERGVYTADVVQGAAGVALNAAGYAHNISNFMRGLHLAGMASAIGEASGAKGWFNTKLTGDPRGICLSRCEDWKKVSQTAYLFASLEVKGGEKKEVRVVSKAFSETVAPDQVITYAVGKAVEQINVSGERPVLTSSLEKK